MDSMVEMVRGMSLLQALDYCGGYYDCPKDSNGIRMGPLVGYAGKDPTTGKNLVGDVYANFAKMECWPRVMELFVGRLWCSLHYLHLPFQPEDIDAFCGAPMGGLAAAKSLGSIADKRFIYPEKKVTKVASGSERGESVLIWDRHQPQRDEKVVLVEDVTNNFSTTGEMIDLVLDEGAEVLLILSLLNRSPAGITTFEWRGVPYPVVSALTKPIPEYKQEDPEVASDIAAGKIVWKPKSDAGWARLVAAVKASRIS